MADIDERFRGLRETAGPDLWIEIERRRPTADLTGDRGSRAAAAIAALALGVAGVALVALTFLGRDRSVERQGDPSPTPPAALQPVVDASLAIRWPSSITYGAGSVWVSASANDGTTSGTIYRIDPDTAEVLAEITSPVVPGWETGGGAMEVADEDVWVAGGGEGGRVVRIDVATNEVALEVVIDNARLLADVAVDEEGIWLSAFVPSPERGDGIEIIRIDPSTGREEARFPMQGSYAREILALEGTIWLHERRTRGSSVRGSVLTRIDPETGQVLATVPLHGGAVMVAQGSGHIWVPTWSPDGGNVLNRIDPHSGEMVSMPSESLEFVIAVGQGGVWGVARRGQDLFDGRSGVVRFDPVTRTVDANVAIEGSPIALAIAPDSVWVVMHREGVTRIALR